MEWVKELAGYMGQASYGQYTFKAKPKYITRHEPVTSALIENHLNGKQPIAMNVLKEPGRGHVCVFDFDDHDGDLDPKYMSSIVAHFSMALNGRGVSNSIVKSSGGRGYHIFSVFNDAYSWQELRKGALGVLEYLEENTMVWCPVRKEAIPLRLVEGDGGIGKGQVEIFPKHESGGLIALPLSLKSVRFELQGGSLIPQDSGKIFINPRKRDFFDCVLRPRVVEQDTNVDYETNDVKSADADVNIEAACAAFKKIKGDVGPHGDWTTVGFIIMAGLGEDGYKFYHQLSKESDGYVNEADVRQKWERGLRSPRLPPEAFWKIAVKGGYRGGFPAGVNLKRRKKKKEIPEEQLKYFNGKYCVVRDGSKVRIGVEDYDEVFERKFWTLMSQHDFLLWERSDWAQAWLSSDERRQYEGFIFVPLGELVIGEKINLWRGWGIEPAPGDWSLIKRHVYEVLAASNESHADYILKWLAWTYQNPNKLPQVALVFKGGRGVGKSTFLNQFALSFGQHGMRISSPEHMTGRFNAHLRDCVGLFADEAFWAGNKAAEGQIKSMITESFNTVEQKYKDPISARNYLHIVIASNEDWVVPAGERERRFACFDVSNKYQQNNEYFEPLMEQMENGGWAAMMHDLRNQDLGGWHPRLNIPQTQALQSQIALSGDPIKTAMRHCLENGTLPGTHEKYDAPNVLMFPAFLDFVRRQAFGNTMTPTKLGRFLGQIPGARKSNGKMFIEKNGRGEIVRDNVRTYEMPSLSDVRRWFDPLAEWDYTESWQPSRTIEEKDTEPCTF